MEKILNKIIGDKIRDIRTEKGLKQADLAKAIGSTPALISNIENGGQSIHLVDLYKIAGLLEKEVICFLPTLAKLKEAVPTVEKEKNKLSQDEIVIVDALRKQITGEE